MRVLFEIIGEFFAHVVASEFLRPVTEPLARGGAALAARVRPLVTVPLLVVVWVIAVGLMIVGWRLGTVRTSSFWTAIATLLWFGAPVSAITITALWFERGRGA